MRGDGKLKSNGQIQWIEHKQENDSPPAQEKANALQNRIEEEIRNRRIGHAHNAQGGRGGAFSRQSLKGWLYHVHLSIFATFKVLKLFLIFQMMT